MTPNEKDYMNRYIYQVTRRLPKDQQDEVHLELEELISDMYAEYGSMEAVLMELGDPSEFANQYRGGTKYLIGPEYFDTYLWFVKVVLICAGISIFLTSMLSAFREVSAEANRSGVSLVVRAITLGMADGITDVIVSGVTAFGFITIIFALMEHRKIQIDMKKAEKWSVHDLPEGNKTQSFRWAPKFLDPVPDKRAVISRSDSIISIVFIVIFCVLLIVTPDLFGAYFRENDIVTVIPILNVEQWGMILPVCVLSLMIGLADEVLRLVVGVYCRTVMISNILCGAVQIVLSAVVLKVLPFWNPNFITEIERAAVNHSALSSGVFSNWSSDICSDIILVFIIGITLLEIGVTIYKTLMYGKK